MSPLTWLVPPLFEPSLGLSAVPLGLVLLVDASRMLAIVFELPPPDVSLALRIVPPGDQSRYSAVLHTADFLQMSYSYPGRTNVLASLRFGVGQLGDCRIISYW